ncbi:hypothetical protein AMAG_02847 [Allomyces macrogynus ATCC 38327]|uniref:Uncharacterized protein n=1 Tax=Allomyces macrogynus (strain ATCC 38327) TaxID=578462 RepID=A0A0L0S3H4_ALLM3|nr:hypothetical protein AMAG_02847 [Allomyces macrogynus ATCC 38327]|eukprot:KNE57097.1 hypothetical protein AMAG_02847 [Allomyces macrogynus ATCC 38327]
MLITKNKLFHIYLLDSSVVNGSFTYTHSTHLANAVAAAAAAAAATQPSDGPGSAPQEPILAAAAAAAAAAMAAASSTYDYASPILGDLDMTSPLLSDSLDALAMASGAASPLLADASSPHLMDDGGAAAAAAAAAAYMSMLHGTPPQGTQQQHMAPPHHHHHHAPMSHGGGGGAGRDAIDAVVDEWLVADVPATPTTPERAHGAPQGHGGV